MSLSTRVRFLKNISNLSHQQCVQHLNANSAQLSRLRTQTGWDDEECIAFLHKYGWKDVVDPHLDLSPSHEARYIGVTDCRDCGMPILYGEDKKGLILAPGNREPVYCHSCRGGRSAEELESCSQCGRPACVLDPEDTCEDCEADWDRKMSDED